MTKNLTESLKAEALRYFSDKVPYWKNGCLGGLSGETHLRESQSASLSSTMSSITWQIDASEQFDRRRFRAAPSNRAGAKFRAPNDSQSSQDHR